jgi:PAS domain S-box-containing protein
MDAPMIMPATVMVIDDEAGLRDAIGGLLELQGHTVVSASRGSEAREQLRTHAIDAAILDLRLPDVSGLDLLAEIRAHVPDSEVIIVTGYASLPTAVGAIEGAAYSYLVKPLDADHLLTVLERALEKQQLTRALRESEERYRLVTENIMDAVFLLDVEGRLVLANSRAVALSGHGAEDVRGRPIVALLTPDGAEEARVRLTGGQAPPSFFETQLVRRDGSRVWIEAGVTGVHKDGVVVGHLFVARDISERKRLAERLLQAQRMEAVGRLAGAVAHDFNNLLTVILGRADMLADESLSGEARRCVELIQDTAERAASLTGQLLAFSRRQALRPRVLDLTTVVTRMEAMLRGLVTEKIDLRFALDPEAGRVKADPGQLQQVLLNLVANARDAMEAGGRLTIATAAAVLDEGDARQHPDVPAGPYVLLAVSDTGVGIEESAQVHLFEPFFTTRPRAGGAGLGLATVYGIVAQSGGHIAVDSEPGRGAIFKVYLPRVDAPTEPAGPADPVIAPTGTETVLLVEDEDEVRVLAREVLTRKGYRVLEAREVDDALRIAATHDASIDVLVTDVVMPKLGGRELAERVVALCPEAKVLYISGYTDGGLLQDGALPPGVAFLQKPFTAVRLALKVREVLDG